MTKLSFPLTNKRTSTEFMTILKPFFVQAFGLQLLSPKVDCKIAIMPKKTRHEHTNLNQLYKSKLTYLNRCI